MKKIIVFASIILCSVLFFNNKKNEKVEIISTVKEREMLSDLDKKYQALKNKITGKLEACDSILEASGNYEYIEDKGFYAHKRISPKTPVICFYEHEETTDWDKTYHIVFLDEDVPIKNIYKSEDAKKFIIFVFNEEENKVLDCYNDPVQIIKKNVNTVEITTAD
jgi:hypothetical protein